MAIEIDGQVLSRAEVPGPAGRPYIGPKAQAAVEEVYHQYVREEARARGVAWSVVWREIMIDGATARYGIKR